MAPGRSDCASSKGIRRRREASASTTLSHALKGTDSRSLESEDQIFTIELPAALEIFAQPKYGARKASSALKEFDADPTSGKPIRIRDGRFGPYVTDGETNASLRERDGDTVEGLTLDRAADLLQARRDAGPSTRGTRKSAARKTGAKMVVRSDGSFFGTIGGGCGEAEVWQEAMDVIEDGRARIVTVDLTQPTDGEDKICGGVMDVFVERIG